MKALIKTLTNRKDIDEAENLGLQKPKPEYGWAACSFRLDEVSHFYFSRKNEIMVCFYSGDDMIIQGDEDMFNAMAAYHIGAENTMEVIQRGLKISGASDD